MCWHGMFISFLYDFIYLSFIVPYMFFFLNNQGVGIKSDVEWGYNTYTMKSIEVYELKKTSKRNKLPMRLLSMGSCFF